MTLASKAEITSVRHLANKTVEVVLKVSQKFNFTSGQYIWLMIPKLRYPDPKGNTRMFSIASSPTKKGRLDIVFRSGESGYKKTLMKMTSGAEVVFSGPFGSLRLPEDTSYPLLFIAGGVGVAPFLSMIRFSSEKRTGHKITLIYANKTKKNVSYIDELLKLEKENSNFKLVSKFSLLNNKFIDGFIVNNISCFVVGPKRFVNNISRLLNNSDIADENITFDQFYPDSVFEPDFVKDLKYNRHDKSYTNNPYLFAVENAGDHIVITDLNGTIIYANQASEKITGYTFDEMLGNTPRLWGALMPADFYKDLWKTIKYDKKSFLGQVKNRRKNQEEYDAQIRISPILVKGEKLVGFISTETDISLHKQIEKELDDERQASRNVMNDLEIEKQALLVAEARNHAILSGLGEGIIITKTNGEIVFVNKALTRILGYKASEILGKKMVDAVPAFSKSNRLIPVNDRLVTKVLSGKLAMASHLDISDPIYLASKSGVKIPIMSIVTPIIVKNQILGAVQLIRDVTKEKEIDRMKSDFISLASHQLRTPLSAVKWLVEMLMEGDAGILTNKQIEYLKNIDLSNQRMIELINKLLNISRIESGRLKVEAVPTNLNELIGKLMLEIKIQSDEKKIKLAYEVDPNLPLIDIDPSLISEVYRVLLDNSLKYTPKGGSIRVLVGMGKTDVVSQIIDNGIGIPENEKSRIYDKFFRAENAVKVDTQGTGLGLYLAKDIVKTSGGKIWYESHEGKGTTFYFSLPLTGTTGKNGEVALNS